MDTVLEIVTREDRSRGEAARDGLFVEFRDAGETGRNESCGSRRSTDLASVWVCCVCARVLTGGFLGDPVTDFSTIASGSLVVAALCVAVYHGFNLRIRLNLDSGDFVDQTESQRLRDARVMSVNAPRDALVFVSIMPAEHMVECKGLLRSDAVVLWRVAELAGKSRDARGDEGKDCNETSHCVKVVEVWERL